MRRSRTPEDPGITFSSGMFSTDNPARSDPRLWIVVEMGQSLLVLTFDGRTDMKAERKGRADVR